MTGDSVRHVVECAVNINIHAMDTAAKRGHWKVVENAASIIESLLCTYERLVKATRIGE
jgi:hypothetical protein